MNYFKFISLIIIENLASIVMMDETAAPRARPT